MKALAIFALVAVFLGCPNGARAQTGFQNLDFEMSIAPPEPAGHIPIADAIPGWQGVATTLETYGVSYNALFLDTPQVGFYDNKTGREPLFGNFSGILMADTVEWGDSKAELFQSGLIPEDAQTLRFATTRDPLFKATGLRPGDWSLSLMINGDSVSYRQVEETEAYIVWGADISSFAGAEAEVRFSLDTTWPSWAKDAAVAIGLDQIEFSPMAIPEPALVHLLLLGLGMAYLKTRTTHGIGIT